MSSSKQLLEAMRGGDFLSKNPDEAMDFLNYVAETSKAWDEPNPRETDMVRPPPNQRGGIYSLSEDMETKAKLCTLTRRLEELEMRNQHEVRVVIEAFMPNQPCFNCQSTEHQGEHCPSVPSVGTLWLNKPMQWANTSHHPQPMQQFLQPQLEEPPKPLLETKTSSLCASCCTTAAWVFSPATTTEQPTLRNFSKA